MSVFKCSVLLIYFLHNVVFSQTHSQKPSYTAAVVEIKPHTFLISPEFALYFNIEQYALLTNYLLKNASRKPDIIVFPEMGLKGDNDAFPVEIPSTEDSVVACKKEQYSMGLRSLSCLALESEVYLVVNLAELHLNVTRNLTQVFSTTIAFDRRGALVAKYRKYNLNAFGIDTPGRLEQSFFLTDFGVTFGLLTGDDILFKEPTNSLVTKYNIKHFVHPSKWYSELPFLTAIQAQSSWAYSNDAVLLSAGYNDPNKGNSGSGIYKGHYGPMEYSLSQEEESFALVADVPKDISSPTSEFSGSVPPPLQNATIGMRKIDLVQVAEQPSIRSEMSLEKMEERLQNIHGRAKDRQPKPDKSMLKLRRDNIEKFTTYLIKPVVVEVKSNETLGATGIVGSVVLNKTLCNEGFCCTFEVMVSTRYELQSPDFFNEVRGDNFTNYRYRLAVFDGQKVYRSDDKAKLAAVQICAIIPCHNDSVSSCGLRTDTVDADTAEPRSIPPVAHVVNGLTFLQTETSFNHITIKTKITGNESAVYPSILLQSTNNEDYGSLAKSYDFSFIKDEEVVWNVPKQVITVHTLKKLPNLASISIYGRLFHLDNVKKSSASIETSSFKLLTLSLIVMCFNFILRK